MAAQLIDHRLRLVFASDIINADASARMTERERDGSANAGARAGDDGFLAFEQFPIFGFRNNRLWQIHEILRMRHFRFRTISCFGWHVWHRICWFCGFVVIWRDSLQNRALGRPATPISKRQGKTRSKPKRHSKTNVSRSTRKLPRSPRKL